jgi:hypothetical protein
MESKPAGAAPVFVSLAWLRGLRDVTRARPSAQVPKGPQGPQALRPQRPSAQRGRAGARARGIFGQKVVAGRKTGRRRPENGSSMPAKLRAMRPPTLVRV